jgi:hypothetical protein
LGTDLGPDIKSTLGSPVPGTGGNQKVVNKRIVFISIETLTGQVDLDPFGRRIGSSSGIAEDLGILGRDGDQLIIKNTDGGQRIVIVI